MREINEIPYLLQAKAEIDNSDFYEMIRAMVDDPNDGREEEVYFYHSDHLGSASWITDIGGEAVQHLQYLPFGERYIDQRMSGYNERFTFTGKEKDEETGYGYFGARYMDHELMTMWLSVDPMADKYPSISPYAYCALNPVKLVDPDGNDWYEYTNNETQKTEIKWTNCRSQKQLSNKDINGKYLGVTAEDGNMYYGLMGDIVDKNTERGRFVMDLDKAIIYRAQAKTGISTKYVDFSNVFNHEDGAGSINTREYDYAGGKAAIAMNGQNMMGRFNDNMQTSTEGDNNRGLSGPMSGNNALKCPRYNIAGQLAHNKPIAGISFHKSPDALKRFESMYSRLEGGNNLTHAIKTSQGWVGIIY